MQTNTRSFYENKYTLLENTMRAVMAAKLTKEPNNQYRNAQESMKTYTIILFGRN